MLPFWQGLYLNRWYLAESGCTPSRGDTIKSVLTACGTPAGIEADGRRIELDYGKFTVVVDDGTVLTVL